MLKVDGLAAGKGVLVASTAEDAQVFLDRVWNKMEFGTDKIQLVVEQFIEGSEITLMGLCDGESFVPLASASDYKRLFDGGQGPNTGGMGAISPSPYATPVLMSRIKESIIRPLIAGLKTDEIHYRGVLYIGLMIAPSGDPFVLEFNARFGDPETQAVLMRLEGSFSQALWATATGSLHSLAPLSWTPDTSLFVVASAQGYPQSPRRNDPIRGLDRMPRHAQIFYSAVGKGPLGLVTDGGRVLGVGGLAPDAASCRRQVYGVLDQIVWSGMHYRRDIGE